MIAIDLRKQQALDRKAIHQINFIGIQIVQEIKEFFNQNSSLRN